MTTLANSIATPEDYAACRQIMFRASKNYSFASRWLPQRILPHVEALYALMRVGDDRVDVSFQGFASPLAAIEDWERAYWDAFRTGDSTHPVMRAYLDTALKFGVPPEVMGPYFRSMKDDLTVARFPTFADLLHYMAGSALPVGRAMTYIVGVLPPHNIEDTLPYADSLSNAMQLSNFWRDVGQDYRIGRVYFPLEDMARFGVTEDDLGRTRITESFVKLMEFEMTRTEAYYAHAMPGIKRLAAGRWGVVAALEVYRAIHDSIRRNGYDVFTLRATTTKWRKLHLALRGQWRLLIQV